MAITPWEVPTAGDDSAEAPLRERFIDALDNRFKHVREGTADPSIHRPHPDRPHDHCGKCSPRLSSTAVPNLLTRGTGVKEWTLGGAAHSPHGLVFSGPGQSAYRRILGSNTASKEAFGVGGCTLRLAFVARYQGTVSDVTLEAGLTDGVNFALGTTGTLVIGDLTTSYKRFGVLIPGFSGLLHVTNTCVRFETTTWTGTGDVHVTLVYLRPVLAGAGWCYWQPGYLESRHKGLKSTQETSASLYDQARDFVNPTDITDP